MAPVEPLSPDALYRRCDPEQFDFETTAELAPLDGVIGQERALAALRFGIGIRHQNYHVFALGPARVGRHTLVRKVLEERAATAPAPSDWCYVHNFAEPHTPRALSLPAGRGKEFRRGIRDLSEELRSAIPAAFESEDVRIRRQAIEEATKKRQEDAFTELQEAAQARQVALLRTPAGMMLAPLRDGEVLPPEEFRRLPSEERERIRKDIEEFQGRLEAVLRQVPQWEREARTQLRQLGQDVTSSAVRHLIDELRGAYRDLPRTLEHLAAMEQDLIETAEQFLSGPKSESLDGGVPTARDADRFRRYWVRRVPNLRGRDRGRGNRGSDRKTGWGAGARWEVSGWLDQSAGRGAARGNGRSGPKVRRPR